MLQVKDVVRMASCSLMNTVAWNKIMDWAEAAGDLDTLKAVIDALPIDSQRDDDPNPSLVLSTTMCIGDRMAKIFVEMILAANTEQERIRLLGLVVKYFDQAITAGVLASELGKLEEKLRAGDEKKKLATALHLHGIALAIQARGVESWLPYLAYLDES